ncbi:OmpA family protein [Apibacter muscae]|nr:OmpA family protein [Apibacter muscae]
MVTLKQRPFIRKKKSNGIIFSKNSYSLSSEAIENLKYAAIIINDTNNEFLIKGSAICTESKKIAKRRARNVRNELIKNGVKKNKLILKAFYSSDCKNTYVEKDVIIKLLNS